MITGQSLRDRLLSLGWSPKYLSSDGRSARLVGLASGNPYFEPLPRIRRMFTSARLPLCQVLQHGMRLRFLGSLRHEVHGIGGGISSTIVKLVDRLAGSNLADESVFFGYLDSFPNPPVSTFPFDSWLTIESVGPVMLTCRDENGAGWTMLAIALTHVTDIEVATESAG